MLTSVAKLGLFVGLLLLTRRGVHALGRRAGAAVRYYVVVGVTGMLVLGTFGAPPTFLASAPVLGLALAYEVVVLVLAAMGLSLHAAATPSPVPLWLSLPCLLAAVFLALFLFIALAVGGAGMVG